jgi:carboxylesterase
MDNNTSSNKEPSGLFYQGNSGHAVILLPGLCGSELELGAIPRLLKQSNHSYHLPTITGYSAHTGITSFESWVEEVDEIATELQETHDSVSIIGLSMGSTLALAVAERNQAIAGLVLLSPVLFFDGWAVPWYHPLLSIVYLLGFRKWHYKESAPYGVKNRELRRRIEKSVKANQVSELGAAHLPASHLNQALKMISEVKRNLKDVIASTLVIHAVDDETASPKNPDYILRHISSDVRKMIWLGNCYHIITVDNEREIVANETISFVNQLQEDHESKKRLSSNAASLVIRERSN